MSKEPTAFKVANLRRAWAAARKDGKDVERTEIELPDGSRFVLVHKGETGLASADAALEDWKARRNAHQA